MEGTEKRILEQPEDGFVHTSLRQDAIKMLDFLKICLQLCKTAQQQNGI